MVTVTKEKPTTEVEGKTINFESVQKRIEQISNGIAEANRAAEDAENQYRQIPEDKKADRVKCLEARDKQRETAESLRKELSFEVIELFIEGALEKTKVIQMKFQSLRNKAEQLVRDIDTANREADEQLEQYRSLLYDGEKQKADKALERVSENRKKAKEMKKQLPELLPEADPLKQQLEDVRLQVCALYETEFLVDLQRRIKITFGLAGQILSGCGHSGNEIINLEDFIQKKSS